MSDRMNNEDAGDLEASHAAGASEARTESWLADRAAEFKIYSDMYARWKAKAKPEAAHVYEGPPSCEHCPFTA